MGTGGQPCGADPVVAIYHRALPQVYGYLLPRCGNTALAEDLTAGTFVAAVASARRRDVSEVTVARLAGPGGSGLGAVFDAVRSSGVPLRTGVITGAGVRQVVLAGPSGNLDELFGPLPWISRRERETT